MKPSFLIVSGHKVSLLSIAQHGFRAGQGTAVPAVGAGRKVDVAYFDFRKAFDMVDNDILLTRLGAVGCTPHVLAFFVCYLRENYVNMQTVVDASPNHSLRDRGSAKRVVWVFCFLSK